MIHKFALTVAVGCLAMVIGDSERPLNAQSIGTPISKECQDLQTMASDDRLSALPREALKDWQTAIPCLIQIIANRKSSIAAPADVLAQNDVLRAAKALRVILDENGQASITYFRTKDNLDVITVLAFAARSNNFDFRVNATLVLGNVVDNSTLCVTLDHLYAPDLQANGRTNLLAVAVGVINYAVDDNLRNIGQAVSDLDGQIPENMPDTRRLIQTAKDRLAKRATASQAELNPGNKNDLLKACRDYRFNWAAAKMHY